MEIKELENIKDKFFDIEEVQILDSIIADIQEVEKLSYRDALELTIRDFYFSKFSVKL